MGASVKYLKREDRTGRLSYRRDFPASLRPFVPGKPREFKRTLNCTDIGDSECARRFADACGEYDRLLALARKAHDGAYDPLDDRTTAYLASKYHGILLATDDEVRLGLVARLSSKSEADEYHQNNLDGFRESKATDDHELFVRSFTKEALELGATVGLRLDPGTVQFRRLCASLLDVRIEAAEAVVGRDSGVPVPTPAAAAPPQPTSGRRGATSPTLDDLINDYTAEKLELVG